jgi:thiosulfate/3-mercaptopyruvate sulfurtransferase
LAFNTLIGTEELASHVADARWIAVDCRFLLADEPWGEHQYLIAHIPGAVYAHLNRDLSGPLSGTNGRHPLPDPDLLATTFIRLGIGTGMQVVAYDQDSGMFASRLWWLLRWMGHDPVAVLDGGFRKWVAEHRPVASGNNVRPPQRFTAALRHDLTVDAPGIARILERDDAVLVDARAPERYRGDVEPLDRVPGHIPGAVNHFFEQNLEEDRTFRSAHDLREGLAGALGSTPSDRAVCYCGSGVTACHNLLAMEVAGMRGARLYPGSWSEWSSDPSRPVERGDKTKGPAL